MVERIVPATPKLAEREQNAINDLRALFPDGNVAGLDSKDKQLGKRLSKLYRALGYESRAALIEALGFRQDPDNKGGRPPTFDPEEVLAELRRRYEGVAKPKAYGILMHENPDLASKIKSISNKSNELFGHSISAELIERGILDSDARVKATPVSDKEILDMVALLEEKYASSARRPGSIAELKEWEPEHAAAIDAIHSRSRKLFGVTAAQLLKDKGIVGKAVVDDSNLGVLLDSLGEKYRDVPNDEKPKSIAALIKECPECAESLTLAQRVGTLSKEALQERGIIGLSASALKARTKLLKERCVRNATIQELIRFYAGSGGKKVVLPGDDTGCLRPGVIGIDLGAEYELREVSFLTESDKVSVGDALKVYWEDQEGWPPTRKVTLLKDGAQVGWVFRPWEDDFLDYRWYSVDPPLIQYLTTTVTNVEELDGKQLARIQHRFLTPISRETMLYALYRLGALSDSELYENDDAWRRRLEKVPETPFTVETQKPEREVSVHQEPAHEESISDAIVESAIDDEVDLESTDSLPAVMGEAVNAAVGVADHIALESMEADEESVDSAAVVLEEATEPELPKPEGWTFEKHQLAQGRRFTVEVPDQYVLTPDENGRPLAHYVEGIDDETEYPEIICSVLAGDLDDETREAFRNNLIPETRIQLSRNGLYSNDMANTLNRIVDDWLVEGKNCQVLVFEVRQPSIFPGFTPDSYEYNVKPVAYDHEDFLRITDSWKHLSRDLLKELALSVAATIELDKPVELKRIAQLDAFCDCPANTDEFCECVAVVSKMLNMSNNERTNAELWKAIRRADNDKGTLMANHRMQRIQAEAYNVGLDEEVAYYERFVRALERQAEFGTPGLDKMLDIVRQYSDAFIVDHITMEDDPEAAKAVNSLGIISIPAAYEELRKRYEDLASAHAQTAEETLSLTYRALVKVIGENARQDGYCKLDAITSAFDGIASPDDVKSLLDECWHKGGLRKRIVADGSSYAPGWPDDEWQAARDAENRRFASRQVALEEQRRKEYRDKVNAVIAGKKRDVASCEREIEGSKEKQRILMERISAEQNRLGQLRDTLAQKEAEAASISGELTKLGFFAFGKKGELKAQLRQVQEQASGARRTVADAEAGLASLDSELKSTQNDLRCQEATLVRAREEVSALEKSLHKNPAPLEVDAAERIRTMMELWACPVTASWCTENVVGVEDEVTATKVLKDMARSMDALEILEGQYVLTGPRSFDRDIEVMAYSRPDSNRMVSQAYKNNLKLFAEIYRRMSSSGRGLTDRDIVDLGISEVCTTQKAAAVMRIGVQTGYVEKTVEKVDGRQVARYLKLGGPKADEGRSSSHGARHTVSSEAQRANGPLARLVHDRMTYGGDGVTIRDVANLGISEIQTLQKAAAVMRVGTELGLFEKTVEQKGEETIARYHKAVG